MNKLFKRLLLGVMVMMPLMAGAQKLDGFAEFGSTLHTGDYTPLWQVSLNHGFASLKNNAYLRGGVFYKDTINNWKLHAGLDIGAGVGFERNVMVQQAYVEAKYRWLGAWAGCKELESTFVSHELSSGDLVWSGNSSPIPQVAIGIFDYVHIAKRVQIKGELSYGFFTDGDYLKKQANGKRAYTNRVKYHHKSLFFRFGNPEKHWLFDIGLVVDNQFGGYLYKVDGTKTDMGNGLKSYIDAFIPNNEGAESYFAGNMLGSENVKLTYQNNGYVISAYLINYFEDMSGMGKQNGLDGLWGLEYKSNKRQAINGVVLEYFQSTHQSGSMHGQINTPGVGNPCGGDNYYNNHAYPNGWSHLGVSNGTPFIVSPLYNDNGVLSFLYNRGKAIYLSFKGDIARDWEYRAKL